MSNSEGFQSPLQYARVITAVRERLIELADSYPSILDKPPRELTGRNLAAKAGRWSRPTLAQLAAALRELSDEAGHGYRINPETGKLASTPLVRAQRNARKALANLETPNAK